MKKEFSDLKRTAAKKHPPLEAPLKEKRVRVPEEISRTYYNMIQRCYYPKDKAYKYYGGRGIDVCLRWREGGSRVFWEDMGDRPDGMSLDRKDNNIGYSPENCHWLRLEANRIKRSRAGRHREWDEGLEEKIRSEWAGRITASDLITKFNITKSNWNNIICGRSIKKPTQTKGKARSISWDDAELMRRMWAERLTRKTLADRYGLKPTSVNLILYRKAKPIKRLN